MCKGDDDHTETAKDQSDSADDEESNQDDLDKDEPRPAGTKRGERPDNLRRRSEWFQKRTGGR